MSDDIEAVKEETIRIVDLHAGTCLAASKYVMDVSLQRSRYTPGPLNLPQSTIGQASRFVSISVNRLQGQEIKTEASVSLACQLDT